MTEEREGSVRDLYQRRQARRTITSTIDTMERAGLDTTTLKVQLDDLNDTVYLIPVPCLVCRRHFNQPANVADDSLPYAVLCTSCDEKIMAEIAAMDQPKRRRRTKAEMEAERAAQAALDPDTRPPATPGGPNA